MNDSLLVRRFQRFGSLTRDRQRLFERNRSAREPVCERRSIDQLQHQRLHAIRRFHPVDSGYVRMVDRGEQLGFAPEPRQAVWVECEELGQDLQSNFAIQPRVARSVHFAHGTRTKRSHDFVGTYSKASGKGCVKRRVFRRRRSGRERIGQHGLTGDGEPIEETDVRGVPSQQRLDFTPQRVVVAGRSG